MSRSVSGDVAATGVAGCSGETKRTFEASPVVLPDDDQGTLRLAETNREPETISRTGPADTEIEITNHAAVYKRAVGLGGR